MLFMVMKHRAGSKEAEVVDLAAMSFGDEELVSGLSRRDPRAAAVLYDRFGAKVNRLVWRLLGADQEHDDVVHQAFVNIVSSIGTLRNPASLEDWITGVTVNTVRREIRSRTYRRLLRLLPESVEASSEEPSQEHQVTARRFFAVLEEMKPEHHVVLALHLVEGNTVQEVAAACGYSLATAKRRIAAAKKLFFRRAQRDSVLASFMERLETC